MNKTNIYSSLTLFLLPLAITLVAVEFGGQVLSAGLARVPHATETLAAYGLAWGLVILFTGPILHAKALSLVMADGELARKRVRRFVLLLGLLLTGALAILALTPFGIWVIEDLHNVDASLGKTVRTAIVWLMPLPVLRGLAEYYTGLLLRTKRTVIVSIANIVGIGMGVVLVFLLLPTAFIQESPIWLPILATYVNVFVGLAIVGFGVWYLDRPNDRLNESRSEIEDLGSTSPAPTYRTIVYFIWPLSLNILFQEFSRPLINIFIARSNDGVEALAVLTIAYALGQFPYRWLNDARNLATAFREEERSLYYIQRFIIACGILSLTMMFVLFWTPVRDYILQTVMGLDADFAALCRKPLMLFAIFSPAVALRAYAQGIALKEKRTQLIILCAPFRTAAVWLALVTFPRFGVEGATLGVAALAMGFCVEAVTIWWGVLGRPWLVQRRRLATSGTFF